MTQLTANDLKVRSKDRFEVMDIAHHPYLWECEPEAALNQRRADVAALLGPAQKVITPRG